MDDTEWIPHTTKTGRILYYINPATGECKWQSQLHKRDHHCEPDVKSEKTTQQIECALQEKNVRCKNVTPLFSPHSHEQNHQEMHLPSTQETANKVIAGSGTSSLLQKHDEYTNACCSKDKEEDKSKFQSLQATTHLPNNGEEKSSEVWNNEELVTVDVLGQCKVGSVHGVENGVLVTPLPPSSNNAGNRTDVSYSSSPKGSSLKILRCNQCNEQFSCPNRFTSHLRLHPEIDPLRCPLCSKEYSSTTSLTTHLRTHTGERPFTCLHCQKSFSQSSHLTTHLRVHTGEKPYQCPQCPKTFGQSSHLTLHLRIHNGDKPFQCRVCSKGFSHSSALSTHVRTHTGEKPFQCPHCPKKFGQTSHLKIHIRTHTGERPFQCPHCLKFFRQSCYLAKHVRSHSSTEPAGSPLTQTPQL